jgi:hypothetical protein
VSAPFRLPRFLRSKRKQELGRRNFLWALLGRSAAAGSFFFGADTLLRTVLAGLRGSAQANTLLFEQIPAAKTGISWQHVNGRSPEYYLPETTGAGCAFLDYDNDGWLDIYLVNSGKCDFFTPDPPLRNALYKNNRDGTFTDVTRAAGVSAPGWGTSAVWFDYDNDGKLDLFVCRFADFDKSKHVFCGNEQTGKRYNCSPRSYPRRGVGCSTTTATGHSATFPGNPALPNSLARLGELLPRISTTMVGWICSSPTTLCRTTFM